jgi:hypothetical protein
MARQTSLAKRVQRVSTQQTLPSPVGGLDALHSLAEMAPTNAVEMVNFFPQQFGVRVRKGWYKHATGLPAQVESLFLYSAASGVQQLFAVSQAKLYNVTAQGAVGAPILTGFINNRWQHQMMVNQFGSWLSLVNGFDLPQKYNGTVWTNQTMTPEAGETLNIRDLISVTTSHRRLWYVEKNSGNAWYLDVDAIEGVLTRFGVGEVFKQGGSLREIITWSMDSGDGMRDQTIFISSMGDVAVFQGYDPDDLANWNLVGVYKCGAPVGQRCAIKYASDVLILSEDGVLPLTSVESYSRATAVRHHSATPLARRCGIEVAVRVGDAAGQPPPVAGGERAGPGGRAAVHYEHGDECVDAVHRLPRAVLGEAERGDVLRRERLRRRGLGR